MQVLRLTRRLPANMVVAGIFPGKFDFDCVIERCCDAFDESGKLLFKFRKGAIGDTANDRFPALADICKLRKSRRILAAGPQEFEPSEVVGYVVRQPEGIAAETMFTMTQHRQYKRLVPLVETVGRIYQTEFPDHYYYHQSLDLDSHFQIGGSPFNQGIFNRTFRTALHLDKGNIPGTISNLVCMGDESFSGGLLVFPEFRVAINLRPRDYLGFLGQELWHGNTEITGTGTRLTLVFYSKREFLGRRYDLELQKYARYLTRNSSNS